MLNDLFVLTKIKEGDVKAFEGIFRLYYSPLCLYAAGITGIVLTKLDGTARGGVVLTIREELDVPVKFIGVGEGVDDLMPFDPDDFAHGLFGDAR